MKKAFFTIVILAANWCNAQMKVNTVNTPLLSLSSAMVYRSNTSILPSLSGGALTLTSESGGYESKAAIFTQKINPTGNWWLGFTYTPSGARAGDGMSVVIHNDSRGTSAVGGCGGYLGVGTVNCSYGSPISPAINFNMNLYTGAGNVGVSLGTNGSVGGYVTTGSVAINSGNPIDVLMKYNAPTNELTVTLRDAVTDASWTSTYTVNLSTVVGSSAYLAFTSGTGAATVTQTITKVYYRGARG